MLMSDLTLGSMTTILLFCSHKYFSFKKSLGSMTPFCFKEFSLGDKFRCFQEKNIHWDLGVSLQLTRKYTDWNPREEQYYSKLNWWFCKLLKYSPLSQNIPIRDPGPLDIGKTTQKKQNYNGKIIFFYSPSRKEMTRRVSLNPELDVSTIVLLSSAVNVTNAM